MHDDTPGGDCGTDNDNDDDEGDDDDDDDDDDDQRGGQVDGEHRVHDPPLQHQLHLDPLLRLASIHQS